MKRHIKLSLALGGSLAMSIPAVYAATVDKTHLAIGSVSTSATRNQLWSCQTSFVTGDAGATGKGSWLNADGTWDKTRKVTVDGSVSWPNANISVTVSGSNRVISGNSLPVKTTTGKFPVSNTDDAYTYDRNPNSISAQTLSLSIPASPTVNKSPQCVGGEVGISLEGPAIFNAVDAGGRDAQAYEVQDSCSGHPQSAGEYHYHGLSDCADKSAQFGWALDGFPIWGPIDPSTGKELSNDDLDECHGITSPITIDGKTVTMFHYVANDQYPYTVGCFRGTPSKPSSSGGTGGQQGGGQQGGGQQGGGQQGQQGGGQQGGQQSQQGPGQQGGGQQGGQQGQQGQRPSGPQGQGQQGGGQQGGQRPSGPQGQGQQGGGQQGPGQQGQGGGQQGGQQGPGQQGQQGQGGGQQGQGGGQQGPQGQGQQGQGQQGQGQQGQGPQVQGQGQNNPGVAAPNSPTNANASATAKNKPGSKTATTKKSKTKTTRKSASRR